MRCQLSLNHSPELHKNLIARIPDVTGRDLPEWFRSLESGPAFLRCEERAHWLADEHGLVPVFETARMYTGPDPAIDRAGLFGVASFELG